MDLEPLDADTLSNSEDLDGVQGHHEPDPLEDDKDRLEFDSTPEQRNRAREQPARSIPHAVRGRNGDRGTDKISFAFASSSSDISLRFHSRSRSRSGSRSRSPLHPKTLNSVPLRRQPCIRYETSSASRRYSRSSSSLSDDTNDMETLRRKVDQLQYELSCARAEAQSIKHQDAQPVLADRFKVLHYIVKRGEEKHSRVYLAEPRWVRGNSNVPELEVHSAVPSVNHYLRQHPEIAFILNKDYSESVPRHISEVDTTDGVPQRADSFHESLVLITEHMRDALTEFVSHVPDFDKMFPNFDASSELDAPYLFAYASIDYVEEICPRLKSVHRNLVELLFGVIKETYGPQYVSAKHKARLGRVTKKLLPYLVKPGDILVKVDGLRTRAYRATSWLSRSQTEAVNGIKSHHVETKDNPHGPRTQTRGQEGHTKQTLYTFVVQMWSIAFDGVFGKMVAGESESSIHLKASHEDEEVPIDSLNLFPLSYASDNVQQTLLERGKMFWRCRKKHLVTHRHNSDSHLTNITDRYMVDMISCRKLFPRLFPTNRLNGDFNWHKLDEDEMPDNKVALLFPPTIVGYNLRSKKCHTLFVDRLRDVVWNKKAFEHLVVEHQTKELIQALVTNQLEEEQTTDPISGKGGGLILLLHGGPGTGKTFTAESVAELAEKPLLRVTCGDVGAEAHQVEKYLQRCFRLGKIWDCVVLLDEADVFLEERDVKDLNRNALVSVFLRMLEYYQGILILTSNRVGTFDEAFKSRIQLALHYEKLREPQRRKVWRNFLDRLKQMDSDNIDFNDIIDNIEELGKADMNGREIRNVITISRQLAKYKGERLLFLHLKHAIEVGAKFTTYLRNLNEGETDDAIKKIGGIR